MTEVRRATGAFARPVSVTVVAMLPMPLVAMALSVLPACTDTAQPKRMIDTIEDVRVTEQQSRVLTIDYARRFAGTVDRAADEIAARTADPDVRRAALLWKANAIGACHASVVKLDPIAAFVDMWALARQMEDLLAGAAGRQAFGDLQPIAVEAADDLEAYATQIAGLITGEVGEPKSRAFIEEWVADRPVEDLSFTREYPQSAVMAFEGSTRQGALSAVSNLEERVAVYSQFLPLVLELLPRQARWQAELMVQQYVMPGEIDEVRGNLHSMSQTMVAMQADMHDIPDMVDRQRLALSELIDQQRVGIERTIDGQRVAATAAIDQQRRETLDVLRAERETVLREVGRLRVEALAELDKIAGAVVEGEATALADRLFWRVAALGAVALAAAALAGFAIVRYAPRSA